MKLLTLKGLRILNTRPQAQCQLLNQAINAAGGIAINFPTLVIKKTAVSTWLESLLLAKQAEQAIFTSANAVNFFYQACYQHHFNWPIQIIVSAIGQATAQALLAQNTQVDHIPGDENSEGLLALPHLQNIEKKLILLVKGKEGRSLIAETLKERGALLTILEVYQRDLPIVNKEETNKLWQDDLVDIILFTSQQAMQNLFTMLGEQATKWLQQKPCVVLSSRLAQAASLLGIQTIIVSRMETIIDAFYQFNQGLTDGK